MEALPRHLRRYVVEQDYAKYTPVDQAVWRFVLRQLRAFLGVHAHESYLDGLQKTGIEVERIPKISEISEKLSKFGWRALPVSGFIPPAAFMELQALSVLPIASDMRTIDHLLYTPAPDIVHEAAGHAPIIANPEFAQYLKEYAQVARKAIISKEDLLLYESIRDLSDLKEDPSSTPEQIQQAQETLEMVSMGMSHVSEATELSRMNWWTAEYGLIGTLENPKLFGAGLLSSVGESRLCLNPKVKKIPLTVDCIRQSYDITEQQPQLFVTPDFKTLSKVLEDMAAQMAFRTGGLLGLTKALQAKTVNTVQWSSGAQVGGELSEILIDQNGQPAYLRFQGPCQIAFEEKQIPGHDKSYHSQGFGSPVGKTKTPISQIQVGQTTDLEFESGVKVSGKLISIDQKNGQTLIMSFENCKVTFDGKTLFEPEWGTFDMAVGEKITSVFGGPPDRLQYGETDDFVAKRIPARQFSEKEKLLHAQYQKMRDLREENVSGSNLVKNIEILAETHAKEFPRDWLLLIEGLELILARGSSEEAEKNLRHSLQQIQKSSPENSEIIEDGIRLAREL